jgi:hypothetical protein
MIASFGLGFFAAALTCLAFFSLISLIPLGLASLELADAPSAKSFAAISFAFLDFSEISRASASDSSPFTMSRTSCDTLHLLKEARSGSH